MPFKIKLPSLKKKPKKEIPKEEPVFKIELSKEIIKLPDVKDKTKLDVRYPLIAPYAYAHIFWEKKSNELVYYVEEPKLNKKEQKDFELIEAGIRELINISFVNIKDFKTVVEYLEKNLKILLNEFKISIPKESFLKYMYYLYRDFVGLNEIEPLMNDYFIEDIECNGSNTPVYIIHRKYRNLRTNIIYKDNHTLRNFVEKLAQKCGSYISYATPVLDAKLPDGSRLNATYTQEITARGPTYSIRKFTKEPWTPIKLMEFRTISPEILAYLWLLIEHKANIIIIGATGSGKTSLLNSIAFFIPPASRIISIEETREINLLHENWLPSVSRAARVGGKGEISMFDLLKASFRQRPDYVIVGEIRGEEAFVLFQGASAGHPVMSTMHADSVRTMVRRLRSRPINLSETLIETLDIVCTIIETKVKGKSVRRLRDIEEVISVEKETGRVKTNIPFVRDPRTDRFYFKTDSRILEKIASRKGLLKEDLKREFRRRSALLMEMFKRKIFEFKEVQEVINLYYKNPEAILKKFEIK